MDVEIAPQTSALDSDRTIRRRRAAAQTPAAMQFPRIEDKDWDAPI
jgi:hypothetical protein